MGDMAVLSPSETRLRALQDITLYWKEEHLTIFQKTKIYVFTKNFVKQRLQINGQDTEQVNFLQICQHSFSVNWLVESLVGPHYQDFLKSRISHTGIF